MHEEGKWYNILNFIALLSVAVLMPMDWHVAIWAVGAVAVTSFIKVIAQWHIGNPALPRFVRWSLLAVVIYVSICGISILYSSDTATAFHIFKKRAALLILPLCLLLSDTSYIRTWQLRVIGYALVLSMLAMIPYKVCEAIERYHGGASIKGLTSSSFDLRHHAYISLYGTAALTFILNEIVHYWHRCHILLKILLVIAPILIIANLVVLNSRAALLCMACIVIVYIVHAWICRQRVAAIIFTIIPVAVVGIAASILPGHNNRIKDTIVDLTSENAKDIRLGVNSSSLHACSGHWIAGYGVGDYEEALYEQQKKDNADKPKVKYYNAHNQYLEAILSVGIIGLLPLLVFLISPIVGAIRSRDRRLFICIVLTCMVCLNLLFESMLERQAGLLFIAYIYIIIALIMSVKKNKFGAMENK